MRIAKLLGIADVTYRRIEPYVEYLAFCPLYGYRDAPIEVARHGTRMEAAVEPALALTIDVTAPFLVLLENPLLKPLLVFIQRKIPVLGRLLDKRIARLGVVRIDEFLGRKRCAAYLALVTISLWGVTARTFTANVAVGKEVIGLLIVELFRHLLDELPVVIELAEEITRELVVRLACGAAIDVERDAEALEAVLDEIVVAVNNLLNRNAFLAGTNRYRHAVLVAATDKKAFATLQPQIACIDVSRHIDTSQMPDMNRSVCVRQSGRNESPLEMFFHVF